MNTTKVKGGLGVCKVVEYFIRRGIPVFTEAFCDSSELDLVVQCNGLHGIQVRSASIKNDKVLLKLTRVTPGTRNTPCKITRFSSCVDIFALYVVDNDTILWIPSRIVEDHKTVAVFRFSPTRQKDSLQAVYFMTPPFLK